MAKTTLSLLLAAALAVPGFALAAPSTHRAAHAPQVAVDGGRRAEGARHGRRAHAPEDGLVTMAAELELEPRQVSSVREVMQRARAERAALTARKGSPEWREQRRAIVDRAHAEIAALLTPAQRASLGARLDGRVAERAERETEILERAAERAERAEREAHDLDAVVDEDDGIEDAPGRGAHGSERAQQRGARGAEHRRIGGAAPRQS